jgi:ABC-type multidrug transport system fused ATPase/permease subunit
MHKYKGSMNVFGSIAFVPQISWIKNSNIKENIIFGNNFDKDFYQKCINVCDLEKDFEGKYEKEIEEKVRIYRNLF